MGIVLYVALYMVALIIFIIKWNYLCNSFQKKNKIIMKQPLIWKEAKDMRDFKRG